MTKYVHNFEPSQQFTCYPSTFSEVEVRDLRAVEHDHVESRVVQGGALGHVEVGQGQLIVLPDNVD